MTQRSSVLQMLMEGATKPYMATSQSLSSTWSDAGGAVTAPPSRMSGGTFHLLPPPPLTVGSAEGTSSEIDRMAAEIAALRARLQELGEH